MDTADALIQSGLRAWADGDLTALATVLDPDVELRGYGPGELDCTGRDEVLELLGQRAAGGAMRIDRIDEGSFVVSPEGEPSAGATRITFTAGCVTMLQQYRSRAAAIRGNDLVEDAAIRAVRTGAVAELAGLLADRPELATMRLSTHGDRTLLHVATDWPGHFPNVVATIEALVAAGADVNAPSIGDHTETALHWAASSDDVEALDALLDAGADIEAAGAVIGGGTALADATAFGQWRAARRLIERGARATLWEAASLGLMPVLRQHVEQSTPSQEDLTHGFWSACHGNQAEAAGYLLDLGADINWIGWDELTPLDAAQRSGATDLLDWLRDKGGVSATELP